MLFTCPCEVVGVHGLHSFVVDVVHIVIVLIFIRSTKSILCVVDVSPLCRQSFAVKAPIEVARYRVLYAPGENVV